MCVSNHIDKLIQNYTILNLPHSNIVVGESGSGKHTLVNRLAEKLNLTVRDITENISPETIEEVYVSTDVCMYIIDGNSLSVKEQNAILKFVEEPSKTTYIFILVDNVLTLLPTIRNRCISINIPPYTEDELKAFTTDDLYLFMFHTPGLIKRAQNIELGKLIDYQNKMIDSVSRANLSNVLSIKDKIKIEIQGIDSDYDMFFRVFERVLIERMKIDTQPMYRTMFECVNKYFTLCHLPKVTLENMFNRFLLDFKAISDGYKRG